MQSISNNRILLALKIMLLAFFLLELFFLGKSLFFVHQSADYTSFLSFVEKEFKGSFLVDDIQKNYADALHFEKVKTKLIFLCILFLVLIGLIISLYFDTIKKLPSKKKFRKIKLKSKDTWILPILLILWLGYKIFLFFYLPLHIDEMFDFVFYTKNSWFCRRSYIFTDGLQWYNNHILYCDISAFFYILGFGNKLAIRLPSILGELGLLFYLWYRFKNANPLKFAFLFLFIVSSFWSGIYSVEGRSYMLLAVVTCISFFVSKDLLKKQNKQQFLGFVLLSVFGFALSKLYLIPFSGIVFFILYHLRKKAEITFWIRNFLIVALLSFLFYAPATVLSGSKAIFTQTQSPNDLGLRLYPLIFEAFSVITNINTKAYLGFLALAGYLYFFRVQLSLLCRKLILFVSAQFISVIVFSLALGTYFPERFFIYFNVCFTLLVAIALWDVFKKKKIYLAIFSMVWIANTIFNFNYSWLAKNERFVLGREYYSKMKNAGKMFQKLCPRECYVDKAENELLIFGKYYSCGNLEQANTKIHNYPILKYKSELRGGEKFKLLSEDFEIVLVYEK